MSNSVSMAFSLVTALAYLGVVVIAVRMIVIMRKMTKETARHTEAMDRKLAELRSTYPSRPDGRQEWRS